MSKTSQAAVLMLQDGTIFKGTALGKIGTTTGEICFNTGMTGYQEIYTDPSYYGQVVINTSAHIGNYGVKLESEEESAEIKIKGMICNSYAEHYYSRNSADESLQTYFEKHGLVGIADVDTRQIVRHVRDAGVMNCVISSENFDETFLKKELDACPNMDGLELSSFVSTHEPYLLGEPSAKYKLAVIDYGCKRNILRNFIQRDCYIKVFNGKTSFKEMMEFKPDGFFISNGPGDPGAMNYAVETIKEILAANMPTFGICLGHQLLGRAVGLDTYKMHNGHRGLNHPVKNLASGKSEITSQNHGFAIDPKQAYANPNVEVTHINLNDNTIEGIRILDRPAFSVQYHPEAAPGPHDSVYLFDQFVATLGK
jgi:carbamoyl-phosphate synthase small subunit